VWLTQDRSSLRSMSNAFRNRNSDDPVILEELVRHPMRRFANLMVEVRTLLPLHCRSRPWTSGARFREGALS
jgi:hypothetical protein